MVTLVDGSLYQWDTGRVVQIDPDTDYVIHEVHFATRKMDFAYVVKTYTENGKPIVRFRTSCCSSTTIFTAMKFGKMTMAKSRRPVRLRTTLITHPQMRRSMPTKSVNV